MQLTSPTPPGYIEERYRKRSAAISGTVFLLLLLALILPLFTYPTPPLGQEGITVNLGVIDLGEGDANAAASAKEVAPPSPAEFPDPAPEPIEATPVPVEVEPEPEPVPEPAEPEPAPAPEPDRQEELLADQRAEALAIQQRKAEAADRAKKLAESARKQREAAARAEAQRKADEAKRLAAQAAAEKAAREKRAAALRASTADLFGGDAGSGSGKGNTGKAGNQGDPNGDPNASRLTGLSSGGAGDVGGGLADRGVLSSPKLTDNSQRRGIIRVAVCVDGQGRVSSARYTQRGSTSNDDQLKRLAIANAKQYRFTPSGSANQCGHITYEFVVQ